MNSVIKIIRDEINHRFLNEETEPRAGYYISTGMGAKKYTLRHWYYEFDAYGNERLKDYHVETYGQDLEAAKERAKQTVGYVPEVRAGEVGKITQQLTYQHMPNGQYQGKHFNEVPINYLTWWAEKYKDSASYQKIIADITVYLEEKTKDAIANYDKITFGQHAGKLMKDVPTDYLSWLMKGGRDAIVRGASELELQKRGEIVDGRSKSDVDRENAEKVELERKANAGWIGNVGDKIEVEVKVINDVSFETQWGTTYITRFIDRNGNTILYKGKPFLGNQHSVRFAEKAYKISNNKLVEVPNPYEGQNFSSDESTSTYTLPNNLIAFPITHYGIEERSPNGAYLGTNNYHYGIANNNYGKNDSIAKKVDEFLKQSTLNIEVDPAIKNAWLIVDTEGNFYKINRKTVQDFEKGDWILLSGTISQHNEYKGEKQTVIQRPKFIKKL